MSAPCMIALREPPEITMADTVSREEFSLLDDRVRVVERDVNGEKQVTRYVLDQVRLNGDDLAAIKSRMDRLEVKLQAHDLRFDSVDGELGLLKKGLRDLRKELPGIVADAMREVLGKITK